MRLLVAVFMALFASGCATAETAPVGYGDCPIVSDSEPEPMCWSRSASPLELARLIETGQINGFMVLMESLSDEGWRNVNTGYDDIDAHVQTRMISGDRLPLVRAMIIEASANPDKARFFGKCRNAQQFSDLDGSRTALIADCELQYGPEVQVMTACLAKQVSFSVPPERGDWKDEIGTSCFMFF